LSNTKKLNASLVVAGEDESWGAVGAAARVMKKLEETNQPGAIFRFAAIAMVRADAVFSPRVSHRLRAPIRDCAGIGERGGRSVQGCADLATPRQRLTDSLALALSTSSGTRTRRSRDRLTYMGSIFRRPVGKRFHRRGIENLTTQPAGMSGTLTRRRRLPRQSKTFKVNRADIRIDAAGPGGYCAGGALERRAPFHRCAAQLSAVCGTGLDTIPFAGPM